MADTPTSATAQLQERLAELQRDIEADETYLRQRMEILGAKRARHKRMAEALEVLTEEFRMGPSEQRPALESDNQPDDGGPPPDTLGARVLKAVLDNPRPHGIAPGDVTKILGELGVGAHITPRTFYSMVYMNLKKLADRGLLVSKQGPNGRLFFPAPRRGKP